jgi:hypothetical protein
VSAFDTPHVVFLLAARPEHAKRVVAAAAELGRDEMANEISLTNA